MGVVRNYENDINYRTMIPGEDMTGKEGYAVCWDGSDNAIVADGGSTQPAAQQLVFAGVCIEGNDTGGSIIVQESGVAPVKVGTGGATNDAWAVVEAATGKLIAGTRLTIRAGDYVAGPFKTDGSSVAADGEALVNLDQGGKLLIPCCESGDKTDISTAGAGTYTAAQILGSSILNRDPAGAGRTDTTATAAQLVAAGMRAGDIRRIVLINAADAAEAITIAGGTGVTVRKSGGTSDLAIGQNEGAQLTFVCTNSTASSEAVTLIVTDFA